MPLPVFRSGVPLFRDSGGGVLVPSFADDPCDCCESGIEVTCRSCGSAPEPSTFPTQIQISLSGFTDYWTASDCCLYANASVINGMYLLDWFGPTEGSPNGSGCIFYNCTELGVSAEVDDTGPPDFDLIPGAAENMAIHVYLVISYNTFSNLYTAEFGVAGYVRCIAIGGELRFLHRRIVTGLDNTTYPSCQSVLFGEIDGVATDLDGSIGTLIGTPTFTLTP
jgi:hypothetical protein